MNNGKIICWFSCGVTSAVACKIAVQKYGSENCLLYYIEIKTAHPDNERFIEDAEKWIGCKIHRVSSMKHNDQFSVIENGSYINGPTGAPCTQILKKDVRRNVEKNISFSNQVFGFEFTKKEINRAVRFMEQHPHTNPLYPLIELRMNKGHCKHLLKKAGIRLPAMYLMGYDNNNCIGCVKGGMWYWNKIRKDFPEVFERMKNAEQKIGATCINGTSLNDLHPKAGRANKESMQDCGLFREVELAEVISPKTLAILEGANIYEL